MRVLFLTGLTARTGGWLHQITRHLVEAVTGGDPGGAAAVAANVPIPCGDLTPAFYELPYPPDRAEEEVRSAVVAFSPDVVHVTGGGIRFLRTVDWVCQSAGVPWVFTAHNIPPAERAIDHWFGRNAIYYAARDLRALPSTLAWRRFLAAGGFAGVVAHSRIVADRAESVGCPAGRVWRIPFGADLPADRLTTGSYQGDATESVFPAGDGPKVLCVAALIHHKGQHDLLRAVAAMTGDTPPLRLALVSSRRVVAYESFIRRRVADLKLGDRVKLTYQATEATLAAAWGEADLYVQPSHEEGFCFAFLEGLIGVPRAVGTAAGAMPEMRLDDPLVAIVPPKDPGALAAAIGRQLAVPVPPDALPRRRAALLEAFSWERYQADHLRLYAAAMKRGSAAVVTDGQPRPAPSAS